MPGIWEQQPGESTAAFGAFLFYRERPAPRTVVDAYREWSKDPAKKKASGRWAKWCAEHKWVARATAYDLHIDSLRRAAQEKAVTEIHQQRQRELELSNLAVLKETTALAQSSIKDVVEWDETGKITRVVPSKDLPDHVAAAISKISVVHDKQSNPNLTVEMHPKVRPLDLLGQHLSLWEAEKKQAQRAATNAFLEYLNFVK